MTKRPTTRAAVLVATLALVASSHCARSGEGDATPDPQAPTTEATGAALTADDRAEEPGAEPASSDRVHDGQHDDDHTGDVDAPAQPPHRGERPGPNGWTLSWRALPVPPNSDAPWRLDIELTRAGVVTPLPFDGPFEDARWWPVHDAPPTLLVIADGALVAWEPESGDTRTVADGVVGPIGVAIGTSAVAVSTGEPPFTEAARIDLRSGRRLDTAELAPATTPLPTPDGGLVVVSSRQGYPAIAHVDVSARVSWWSPTQGETEAIVPLGPEPPVWHDGGLLFGRHDGLWHASSQHPPRQRSDEPAWPTITWSSGDWRLQGAQ